MQARQSRIYSGYAERSRKSQRKYQEKLHLYEYSGINAKKQNHFLKFATQSRTPA